MARKQEQKLWDRMRSNLRKEYALRLERFENAVGTGIPDVLSLYAGRVVWCELKAVEQAPVRAATKLLPTGKGLSVEQRNWHLEWQRHGGTSCILVSVGSSAPFLLPGEYADEVNHLSLASMELRSAACSWLGIAQYLKGGKK